MDNLKKRFKKYENASIFDFDKIENKLSQRKDLHAFLLLDKIMPGNNDIIGSAAHDEIYLNFDCEKLNKVITDEQILELRRCGVLYDNECECLMMFA